MATTIQADRALVDYAKTLHDLEALDLAGGDELAEFKRTVCGCSTAANRTDDSKNTQTEPIHKTEATERLCADLVNAQSAQAVETIAKLIAELSKEGLELNFFTQLKFNGF